MTFVANVRNAVRVLPAVVVAGLGTAMLSGCGTHSIAFRTYAGVPAGTVPPTWSSDIGGDVAVIEAPDRLDIAVWAGDGACYSFPVAMDAISRHEVRIRFHWKGRKGCSDSPGGVGPVTSELKVDPAVVDTTTDLQVTITSFNGPPRTITAKPR